MTEKVEEVVQEISENDIVDLFLSTLDGLNLTKCPEDEGIGAPIGTNDLHQVLLCLGRL